MSNLGNIESTVKFQYVSFSWGIISKLNFKLGAGVTLWENRNPIHIIKACHPPAQGRGGDHSVLLQGCPCQQQGQGTGLHVGCLLRVTSPKDHKGWITGKRERPWGSCLLLWPWIASIQGTFQRPPSDAKKYPGRLLDFTAASAWWLLIASLHKGFQLLN